MNKKKPIIVTFKFCINFEHIFVGLYRKKIEK